MSHKKIVIAGGGLTGLSAAWQLQRRKRPFLLFEREREVGGLCHAKKTRGFTFDQGGHVLHFRDPRIFSFVKGFLGSRLIRHKRVALFHSFGKYGRYPFQANLYGMPSRIISECLCGAQAVRKGNGGDRDAGDLASWIIKNFGKGLARNFLFPYNTKFWTVPLGTLTSEWARTAIPVPSREEIVAGALGKNARDWGYNSVFWYPEQGGIHQLPLAIASDLKNVVTDCPVTAIDLRKKEVVIATGAKERFESLITTIPLPQLLPLLRGCPPSVGQLFGLLRWNSIRTLHLGIEGRIRKSCHWVYFPEKSAPFFRISLPHRFSGQLVPRGHSALSLEIAYKSGQPPERERCIQRSIGALRRVGILSKDQRISFAECHDIVYGYPIYDRNYARVRQGIMRFLAKHRIICAGRYGAWRYMSMEDAIREGRSTAQQLISENA